MLFLLSELIFLTGLAMMISVSGVQLLSITPLKISLSRDTTIYTNATVETAVFANKVEIFSIYFRSTDVLARIVVLIQIFIQKDLGNRRRSLFYFVNIQKNLAYSRNRSSNVLAQAFHRSSEPLPATVNFHM